ncbi:MAG: hypothetical protein A3K10_04165 [Bacteroidetes bacterium RIFCSPLOWO2_12_FULL_31_6]|nr:MAG: hypothetical protein A3K10_04165 [Bacteroidetes bacterium RIFCSPLOWO2_12_FULL_31_6]
MKLPVSKEYWFITGTSSGIGKAIAETILKRKDAIVVGISRNKTITHSRYVHFCIDLSSPENIRNFNFGYIKPDPSRLVLVNNAGTLGEIVYAGNLNNDAIAKAYNTNIVSAHILINKFIDDFRKYVCKKIILNVSSGAATNAYDGWSVYCATKAAMDMITACIAKEQETIEEGLNCKIYSVAPGVVDTKMQNEIRETDSKSFSLKEKFIELHKNNQLINPVDAAKKIIDIVDGAYKDSKVFVEGLLK